MTGPEHYREAEQLLAASEKLMAGNPPAEPFAAYAVQRANVHAVLALAAAQAFNCDCVAGEAETAGE